MGLSSRVSSAFKVVSAQVSYPGTASFPMNFVTENKLVAPLQTRTRSNTPQVEVLLTVKDNKSGKRTAFTLTIPSARASSRGFQRLLSQEGGRLA